ncbi:MAG: hypothetical protein O3C40_31690 [Planctomycetota bacterium]|nr:hypothetical protein [Planctomycetota bacterium]
MQFVADVGEPLGDGVIKRALGNTRRYDRCHLAGDGIGVFAIVQLASEPHLMPAFVAVSPLNSISRPAVAALTCYTCHQLTSFAL